MLMQAADLMSVPVGRIGETQQLRTVRQYDLTAQPPDGRHRLTVGFRVMVQPANARQEHPNNPMEPVYNAAAFQVHPIVRSQLHGSSADHHIASLFVLMGRTAAIPAEAMPRGVQPLAQVGQRSNLMEHACGVHPA